MSVKMAQMLKVGETAPVVSTLETGWKGAVDVPNKADIISIVMSPTYVKEILEGRNGGYCRFASMERVEELLALGNMDEDGYQYYKIVREGEGRGIYCVNKEECSKLKPEDGLELHEPSIRNGIKNKRPLQVYSSKCLSADSVFLSIGGRDVTCPARVAQFEVTSSVSKPQTDKPLEKTLRDEQKM